MTCTGDDHMTTVEPVAGDHSPYMSFVCEMSSEVLFLAKCEFSG